MNGRPGHVADLNYNPPRLLGYERRDLVDYVLWRIYDVARQPQIAGNFIEDWHVHIDCF